MSRTGTAVEIYASSGVVEGFSQRVYDTVATFGHDNALSAYVANTRIKLAAKTGVLRIGKQAR